MWSICNHPRVPAKVRDEMKKWGLAKDEFIDTNNWPHQIYVREARRMVGEYIMTELDCRKLRATPESIGMGSYNMDSHNCMRYVTSDGKVQNEGDIQVSPGGPYKISYKSITPKKEHATNLLVPVCISCSHMAYGSIRMEPVFFILGQSAATAACLAIDAKIDVQDLPYEKLKTKLLEDKQVLESKDAVPSLPALDPKKMAGVVIDDIQAIKKVLGAKVPPSLALLAMAISMMVMKGMVLNLFPSKQSFPQMELMKCAFIITLMQIAQLMFQLPSNMLQVLKLFW